MGLFGPGSRSNTRPAGSVYQPNRSSRNCVSNQRENHAPSRRAGLCFLLLLLPGSSVWAQPEASPATTSQLLADAAKRREEMREQLRVENEAKLKVLQQQLDELDKELVGFKAGDEASGDLKRTIFDRHIQDRKIMQARVLADPENITKGGLKPSLNLMLHALEYFLSMKPIGAILMIRCASNGMRSRSSSP